MSLLILRRIAGLGAAAGMLAGFSPSVATAQNNDLPGAQWIVRIPAIDDALAPPPLNLAGRARVRLVQAIPNQTLDLSIDRTVIFGSVAPDRTTAYQAIAPESLTLGIGRTGSGSPESTRSVRLEPNRSYTAIATIDAAGKPALRVVPDIRVKAPSRGASVRIVSAAADTGPLEIYSRDAATPLFPAIVSGDTTPYRTLSEENPQLEVTSQQERAPRVRLPSLRLQPGRIYTILLTGQSTGPTGIGVTMIDDGPEETLTGAGAAK